MKRCSLLEKCKSKLQWDTTSHWSEWPSSKSLQTINAGEDVEKREPSCIVGRNVNRYSQHGRQYGDSSKKQGVKPPSVQSVQSLSCVHLFATPWTAARQAFLSINNSRSLPKLMCIESVMPSSHLILCHPLLLLPSIFPNIRVFSNESALCIRWPKYWSFQLQHQSFQWIFRTDFL